MQVCRVPLPWSTQFSDTETEKFFAATPWMESAGIDKARATFEIRVNSDTTYLQIRPAWQVANTEDSPGTSTGLAAAQKLVDVYYPTGGWINVRSDSNAPGEDNLLVRFGWLVRLDTGGSGLQAVQAAGVVEYLDCS